MKTVIAAGLAWLCVKACLGQGTVDFKATLSKDPILYSLDGKTGLTYVGSDGQIPGGYGPINFELYTAPTGTVLSTDASGRPNFAGWTGTSVPPPTFFGNGVVLNDVVTLPVAGGSQVQMAVEAYTGSLLNPTFEGWSGLAFNGSNVITVPLGGGSINYPVGALSWTQFTGNPNGLPVPTPPGNIPTGASGMGPIILEPVPDVCSTFLLGGVVMLGLILVQRKAVDA